MGLRRFRASFSAGVGRVPLQIPRAISNSSIRSLHGEEPHRAGELLHKEGAKQANRTDRRTGPP